MPEECPEAVELLIEQCLEKEVSRRPNARQVYTAMQTMLKNEGGLPDEPVRVVNTTDSTFQGSSGTDSTFDSAGSRMSAVSQGVAPTGMVTANNSIVSDGGYTSYGIGPVAGNNNGAGAGTGNGVNNGVRISRGNTALTTRI